MTARLDPDAERMLRDLAPRVLGALLRRAHDLPTAEDAVQEALLAAFVEWPERGVPDNPGGWLYRTATRRLADMRDSDRARRDREATFGLQRASHTTPPPDTDFLDDPMHHDDTLHLLFTCCAPVLAPPSAIALLLRAVGGLTTAEIARAFLVPEATMAQRISRAKQTLAAAGTPFPPPDLHACEPRLAAVLHVLYLIFNEGHTGTSGRDLQRIELAHEAIRLMRALHTAMPDDGEVAGLLALLLLTDARSAARTGPDGELVPLDAQDRTCWDRAKIAEGTRLVEAAFRSGRLGSYQLQAAIASLHDEAPDTARTDWPQILALYEVLRRIDGNPMVALGHAIATAMVHGPAAGLRFVDAVAGDERLARSHRLAAVRAHLHEMAGDRAAAVAHYRAAALQTLSIPERQYLLGKAARLRTD